MSDNMKDVVTSTAFSGRYLKVVTFPCRGEPFEQVHIRPSVCVFPVTESGKIILIHEEHPITGKTEIKPVTGFMEETDESPIYAAHRELHEETGLKAVVMQPLHTVNYGGPVITQRVYCVASILTQEVAHPDAGERIHSAQEFDPVTVWQMLWDGKFGCGDIAFGIVALMRHLGQNFRVC